MKLNEKSTTMHRWNVLEKLGGNYFWIYAWGSWVKNFKNLHMMLSRKMANRNTCYSIITIDCSNAYAWVASKNYNKLPCRPDIGTCSHFNIVWHPHGAFHWSNSFNQWKTETTKQKQMEKFPLQQNVNVISN